MSLNFAQCLTTYQRELCGLPLRGCGGDGRVSAPLEGAPSRLQSKAEQGDKLLQCDFAPLQCFDSLFSTREVVLQSHSSTEKQACTDKRVRTECARKRTNRFFANY